MERKKTTNFREKKFTQLAQINVGLVGSKVRSPALIVIIRSSSACLEKEIKVTRSAQNEKVKAYTPLLNSDMTVFQLITQALA